MDGVTLAGGVAGAAEPFSAETFLELRGHAGFKAAVEALARENLADYGASTLAERWLISDLGRAALTGAATILDAMLDGFPGPVLVQAAVANRTCSEGRVRHYLRRAAANGFFDLAADGRYRLSARMHAVTGRRTEIVLRAAARLDSELAPALAALADPDFRRRLAVQVGLSTAARPDLFNGPDKPVMLFLGRDGGMRMLEQVLCAQPARRARLLETAQVSQRRLAQGAFVSRTHVARLLADGEAQGLVWGEHGTLSAAPELSDDVERHYALMLGLARASARTALAARG